MNRRYGGVYELVMNGESCQSVRGRDYSDELNLTFLAARRPRAAGDRFETCLRKRPSGKTTNWHGWVLSVFAIRLDSMTRRFAAWVVGGCLLDKIQEYIHVGTTTRQAEYTYIHTSK